MLWNFNYREPVTKNRINMGLGTYPELSLANAKKKVVEARVLLAQGIDPKVQRNAQDEAKRAETAEEGLRYAGVRRRHLAIAYAACISRPENNAALKNQRTDGHRTAWPNRGQRQPRDSEATVPTAQRDHDLRGKLGSNIPRPPPNRIRAVFKKPQKENMAALSPEELPEVMMEIANDSIKRATRCLIE